LGYLALYNLMFVAPLIIMLALASNSRVAERLERWESSKKKKMKLYSGIIMIALGLFILYGGILH
jgi:cytochrome c biogenesis protein CcdA